jgi:hypothetical protein
MKKLICVLAACMLVFGFSASVSAECVTCEEDPGNIYRGCEDLEDQRVFCYPFDYDDDFGECQSKEWSRPSYCMRGAKGDVHRALFKICDCITEGTFETLVQGDTVDIRLDILVDGEEGDNGVYWAEDIGTTGIPMEPFDSQEAACAEDDCSPDEAFLGEFDYKLANGDPGFPYGGSGCDLEDEERVVSICPDVAQTGTHGYTVTTQDDVDNNSVWWIDIPSMRVDPAMVDGGEQVQVKITLTRELSGGGVCGECEGCSCVIDIGQLCCEDSPELLPNLIYPYFPPMDSSYWGLMGLVVTNLSDNDGAWTATVYETDGDVGTVSGTLGARETFLTTMQNLKGQLTMTDSSGSGVFGDSRLYVDVDVAFNANGFAMIANPNTGESMGYLPVWDLVGYIMGFENGMVPVGP